MTVINNSRLAAFVRVHPSIQRSWCRLNGNEFSASRSWHSARLNCENTLKKARLIATFGQSNGDDLGIGAADAPSSSGGKGDDEASVQSVNWRQILEEAARLVRKNVWVLLMIHFTCDALVFVLHRLSHRLTNELAVRVLPAYSASFDPSMIYNMWWLTADPSVANFETGYQTLTILVFLLAFPMNVLLKTFASIATIVTCNENRGSLVRETPWWNIPAGLWRSIPPVRDLWPGIKGIWQRVFAVEMLVSAAVIPLQFASLAVITLPLTLPIILSLYIATPSAVLEGTKGWEAIQRSRQLIKPLRWDLGIPFVGLVAGQRVLEALKERIMATLTARIYRELIEIPVVIVVGWWVVSIFLARMQDVLPYVSFNAAKRIESSAPS